MIHRPIGFPSNLLSILSITILAVPRLSRRRLRKREVGRRTWRSPRRGQSPSVASWSEGSRSSSGPCTFSRGTRTRPAWYESGSPTGLFA